MVGNLTALSSPVKRLPDAAREYRTTADQVLADLAGKRFIFPILLNLKNLASVTPR